MAGLSTALHWLSIPNVGLGAIFVIALVSATLLPMGSEPAVFAMVKYQPDMFWPAILVATVGNTAGGAITWWMGLGAREAADKLRHVAPHDTQHPQAARWLARYGAKACLLSWLPLVGDPLCAVAGWLRLPFWPCVGYMAVGKFLRYVAMTAALMWII